MRERVYVRHSQATSRVLELALREALSRGTGDIDPEHVLLAIMRHGQSDAAIYLSAHHIDAERFTGWLNGGPA